MTRPNIISSQAQLKKTLLYPTVYICTLLAPCALSCVDRWCACWERACTSAQESLTVSVLVFYFQSGKNDQHLILGFNFTENLFCWYILKLCKRISYKALFMQGKKRTKWPDNTTALNIKLWNMVWITIPARTLSCHRWSDCAITGEATRSLTLRFLQLFMRYFTS